MKTTLQIAFAVPIILLCGCSTQIHNLNVEWEKDNKQLANKIGVRTYQGITKEKAINAMAIAFQRMDMVITSSDFRTGLLSGSATAPKPLSYEEFETVIAAEDQRARSYVPFFVWKLTGFDTTFNVFVLETGDGVQVAFRAKLNYRGNTTDFIPISEFPPKAVEIANRKVWSEFEKILFIQDKTLK